MKDGWIDARDQLPQVGDHIELQIGATSTANRGKASPLPVDVVPCSVCCEANNFNVAHTPPVCEVGKPAFHACAGINYEWIVVDEFVV